MSNVYSTEHPPPGSWGPPQPNASGLSEPHPATECRGVPVPPFQLSQTSGIQTELSRDGARRELSPGPVGCETDPAPLGYDGRSPEHRSSLPPVLTSSLPCGERNDTMLLASQSRFLSRNALFSGAASPGSWDSRT